MLSGEVRILNLDDSLTRQKELLKRFNPGIADLRGLSSACRQWMNLQSASRFKSFLDPRDSSAVTLLGSGDYHHLSSILISQISKPLSLFVFDFHPDWDTMPPRLGCGSWVSAVLKFPNIKKVVLIVVSSEDISTLHIQSAALDSLRDGRLEIYPCRHAPTNVILRKVANNPSIAVERGKFFSRIKWRELETGDRQEVFAGILSRIPTPEVYISIDKDCLRKEYARTNWEEGLLGLDDLLLMLGLIRKKFEIAGLDITGEYSEVKVSNILKKFSLALDHPRDYSACGQSPEAIDRVNEETNIRILEFLRG